MRMLSGPDDVLAAVRDRFHDHPWARICLEGAVPFVAGWDAGDAVVWRSGHPWTETPLTHAVGQPAAAAAAAVAVAAADEEIVAPHGTPIEPGRRRAHEWALRLMSAPCPPQPGEAAVRWLDRDAGDAVAGLLAVGNPHAAVRPGDALGGQWFGAYDEGGLVACGVETVLARPRPHLSSLTVHPRARGRGLGAALTAWFVRRGLDTGASEVLLAVDHDNPVADRLYDRLGFDRWPMTGFYVPREMT